MAHFTKNLQNTGDLISNLYSGADANGIAQKLNQAMLADGYKLSEGNLSNGTYEKGNRVMRILFGAFVKYFKFSLTVTQNQDGTVTANFFKQTSGMSGGLIGIAQVKKELARMNVVLQSI